MSAPPEYHTLVKRDDDRSRRGTSGKGMLACGCEYVYDAQPDSPTRYVTTKWCKQHQSDQS